jgi:hypothetical protein
MLSVVPRVLAQIIADGQTPPAARVKAAVALVEMNEQNARLSRLTAESVPGSASPGDAAGAPPAVRIELSAEGLEALRGNFLGRLAAAGESGGSAGTAAPGRVVETDQPRRRRAARGANPG